MPIPLITIVGATASGKTALGIRLAQRFNGAVISADSRHVYRNLTIGTGKPAYASLKTKEQDGDAVAVEGIPHHLIDICNPDTPFTVVDFKRRALQCLTFIHNYQKIPFLVGGTGLYVKSIVDNLEPTTPPDPGVRAHIAKLALTEKQTLLKQLDAKVFAAIDSNNPRRVERALEKLISPQQLNEKIPSTPTPPLNLLQIGLNPLPERLYAAIDRRIDEQLERGLVDEVRGLLAAGYTFSLPSLATIGYTEIGAYLRGEATLPEAIRRLRFDTRHYAKRQYTWFKKDARIHWFSSPEDPAIDALVAGFLKTTTRL